MEQTLTKSNIQKLEYLDNYKLKQEKRQLIDEMLESDNIEEVEWATLYDIDDHYTAKRISDVQALTAYNDFKPFNRSVEIGIKVFKSYIYTDTQSYLILDEHLMGLEYELDSIQDDYIRGMYKVRHSINSIANLVAKDYIKEARQVCEKIMNDNYDNHYSTLVGLWFGNTFILDNPDKAIEIYEKALTLATGSRWEKVRGYLKNSLDFVNIMMGYYPKYLNLDSKEPSEVHNVAYWFIKKNDIQVAEQLLNTLDIDDLDDVQKAYHFLYRGYVSEPIKHFSLSVKHFKAGGECYFRKLALYELEKLGVDRYLIDAMSN
ncbi:AimR family lysis-lysogeny pheromone receptor [Peribacillus simplex]|uniref:SPBc2 prophage-derived protein YopK n=1 Tax=Peribacillus simplex TaxID=1478 RepID=A0AAN2TS09_9BACI|nr:AimR family lysis-lysogeny pheromone receptor [Peribacillus simplex]CEG31478.1 SPBc2 prophage-derived protein YopK [Peribacillus simplex]